MRFRYLGILIVAIYSLLACNNTSDEYYKYYKENEQIKTEIADNFKKGEDDFSQISSFFNFQKIKGIEFFNDNSIKLIYQRDTIGNFDEMKLLNSQDTSSLKLRDLLAVDSLKPTDLIELKKIFNRINIRAIGIVDNYDVTRGKKTKQINLEYDKSINGRRFFYRIFQEPLDSMEAFTYQDLIHNKNTGNILSKKVIWYYK